MTKVMKPDFLCVGYHKAGTTWLYKNLSVHPEVKLPIMKELDYFLEGRSIPRHSLSRFLQSTLPNQSYKREAIIRYLMNFRKWDRSKSVFYFNYCFKKHTNNWYLGLFDPDKIGGDISPTYTILKDDEIRNIKIDFPWLKIIILLRDPVERMYSLIKMNLTRNQKEIELSNETLFDEFESCQNWQTDYVECIENWSKYYDNVLVKYYDEIRNSPKQLMSDAFRFLGCHNEGHQTSNVYRKVNEGVKASMPREFKLHLIQFYKKQVKELLDYTKHIYPKKWLEEYEQFEMNHV